MTAAFGLAETEEAIANGFDDDIDEIGRDEPRPVVDDSSVRESNVAWRSTWRKRPSPIHRISSRASVRHGFIGLPPLAAGADAVRRGIPADDDRGRFCPQIVAP
ncbi:MAG: hypothetical protein R2838_22990 [Caldilineaceae bacterium]